MQHRASWVRARGRALLWALALGGFAVCSSMAASARADDEDAVDPSSELFREGRQLLSEGRLEQACERFRASLLLRRSPGTLLNVGNCLESEGQLVAAFEAFDEARTLAVSEPDGRKAALWTAAARDEISSVERRIVRVTVTAADPALRVTLDGQPLTAFGEPLRLNPGRHLVAATAEGKQPFERMLELFEGQSETLVIPELERLPTAASPEPPAPKAALEMSPEPRVTLENAVAPSSDAVRPGEGASRVWPWAVIGVGGAVFVGGAVTGVVAMGRESDLKRECPNGECAGDLSARDRAYRTAIAADVLMLTGVVAAGVGTAWLLLSDDGSSAVTAGCSVVGCEASVSGHF